MTLNVLVNAGNGMYRIATITDEVNKPCQFFAGYDFMGSVNWTDTTDEAPVMDIDEAESIIADLDSAEDDGTNARIIYDGQEITPSTAMKWFCWHELVSAMSRKNGKALSKAIYAVESNVPDWEMRVLKKYLDITKCDLEISSWR